MPAENVTCDLMHRLAIRETIEAYFSAIDRRDWNTYGECFASDAEVTFHDLNGRTISGRAALVERAALRENRPISNHLLSNIHIHVSSPSATAVTHGIAHLKLEGDAGRVVIRGIVYEDDLTLDPDGSWRIVRRSHLPLWQFEAAAVPLGY